MESNVMKNHDAAVGRNHTTMKIAIMMLAFHHLANCFVTAFSPSLPRNTYLPTSFIVPRQDAARTRRTTKTGMSNGDNDLPNQLAAMGLNELQTQFRQAIAREDMDAAILYRDELADRVSSGAYRPGDGHRDERKMKRLSWTGLGTAPWLIERLEALEYPLPTTIQINSFEAVNAILSTGDEHGRSEDWDEDWDEDEDTLEERMQSQTPQNMGVVISGSTGSGKTLAYLVPTLSTLSQTLFTRQRIRVKAEEDVGDIAGDLLDRVMVQTSPTVRGQGYSQVGGNGGKNSGALATGAALSSLGKSGLDVRSPVALVVVPTRELGVQIALLLFQLVGGNVKKTATERSGKKNMFKYKGPKGVKIGCVLDDEMSKEGLKLQTDIAVTTPKYLTKLLADNDVDAAKLRVVIYDEADLGLEQTSTADLKRLFDDNDDDGNVRREFSRISYLVGATVTESLGSLAVKDEILPSGKSFIATATRFAPLTKDDETIPSSDSILIPADTDNNTDASADRNSINNRGALAPTIGLGSSPEASKATLKDLRLCLDPGLRHERVIAPNDTGLLCLARMLRKELQDYENAISANVNNDEGQQTTKFNQLSILRKDTQDLEDDALSTLFSSSNSESINKIQRPRVVVFFPDEDEARDAMYSLRDAMWGQHKLCVLLPASGQKPLAIMEEFKNGETSVMLATPNSIRGLDFPALTHVYTLYLPADDPREYLHLAGRVGRIGQQGSVQGKGGRVTSILDEGEAEKMDKLAEFLGFEFQDLEPLGAELSDDSNVEDARRYLEDMITLLGTADEPDSPSE